MKIPNKVYDVIKWVSLVVLPAISTLYWSLASIFGWPYAEQITGAVAAIQTLIGALLGVSAKNYEGDGDLLIDTSREDKDVVRINFNVDPYTVGDRRTFMLKVKPESSLETMDEIVEAPITKDPFSDSQ